YGGQQGIQTVQCAALHGNTDDRQGGVGGKGTGQVSGHTGGTQDDTITVGTGGFGKSGSRLRRTVSREDVGFIRDAEILQHGAGSLDNGPVAVGTHDDRYFFHW